MPADLTIFGAKYLVFLDALLAAAVLLLLLRSRPRPWLVRWAIIAVLLLGLSYVFAKVGAALYTDPRPFTIDHVKPLISHAPDNGFPSDHALLAAALVALVAIVDLGYVLPFVILAVLVDWARVGSGIHHTTDVVGSSLFVALATLLALLLAPIIGRWIAPMLPAAWRRDQLAAIPSRRSGRRKESTAD